MRLRVLLIVALAGVSLAAGQAQPPDRARSVTRSQRPTFQPRDWDGVFFNNLFEEGLVGGRPSDFGTERPAASDAAGPIPADSAAAANPSGYAWSQLIDSTVLEDEIKRLQLELDQQLTTPGNFATDFLKVRNTFALLAVWFDIIGQYDQQVRWKEDAAAARAVFARAAANSRVGSPQAYQFAKRSQEILQNLVRGEAVPAAESTDEQPQWADTDRTAIMVRFEQAYQGHLRPAAASPSALEAASEEALAEVQLIAALAQVLGSAGMIDADDEGYAALAAATRHAAEEAGSGLKRGDFEAAINSINLIDQACNNCHAEWK
jgi:hypothetical protein